MKYVLFLFFTVTIITGFAQSPLDVIHYNFNLRLNDDNDTIKGRAVITYKLLQPVQQISFDLTETGNSGKGMHVLKVEGDGVTKTDQHDNKVWIDLHSAADTGRIMKVTIDYAGVPDDGLIISRNKYGDRTFFADNWPNRAHHWIPCNDRPDDKASFEFTVEAPAHYEVISNGKKVEDVLTADATRRVHWVEEVSLSTKVMVVGAARFSIREYEQKAAAIPVSAWVFPQDSTAGFYDYGVAPEIVNFFSSYIAPFPYNKLANVQSKTIFGGMENASCIFYAEASVTGNRTWEDVVAHEIAHQWFGDMASEKSFAHLWLSEGFATYMTNFYVEKKYGIQKAATRFAKDREEVIRFVAGSDHAVVDSTKDLMSLLNANSYQKGGWVLYMLRQQVGDSNFHRIIHEYYQKYKGGNAETRDLERIASQVYGKDLQWFFNQWLFRPGIPEIQVHWRYRAHRMELAITQAGKPFIFPLTVGWKTPAGIIDTHVMQVSKGQQSFSWPVSAEPLQVLLDPDTQLLFRGTINEIR